MRPDSSIVLSVDMRAPLIVIEGLDRTGKSTQTAKLCKRLNGYLVKFPNRETRIGKLLNQYLTDKSNPMPLEVAHLLFSANRWEMIKDIEDSLNKGTPVVMDRYVYSGVAYSMAKGLDIEWCLAPDKGLPKPDITIFLKANDLDSISQREGFGEERYEVASLQTSVRNNFETLRSRFDEWEVILIDGKDIDQVHEQIWKLVCPLARGLTTGLNRF